MIFQAFVLWHKAALCGIGLKSCCIHCTAICSDCTNASTHRYTFIYNTFAVLMLWSKWDFQHSEMHKSILPRVCIAWWRAWQCPAKNSSLCCKLLLCYVACRRKSQVCILKEFRRLVCVNITNIDLMTSYLIDGDIVKKKRKNYFSRMKQQPFLDWIPSYLVSYWIPSLFPNIERIVHVARLWSQSIARDFLKQSSQKTGKN